MNPVLRIGVLGAAKIARTQLIPAIEMANGAAFWGVASRNRQTAQAFVEQVGGGVALEGYQALLDAEEVDVIYNPLPNDLHVELSIKALEAGKHVLCEKPIALNAEDAKRLSLAASKFPELKVMEAFMYRFHPQWQQVLDWIAEGAIGQVRSVSSQFCYNNHDPANIRNNPAAGGGALMDIGCYGISATRMVMGCEPRRVVAVAEMHPEFGVDDVSHLIMSFADGASATVVVSTKSQRSQSVTIEGSAGRIVLTHPFYCDEGDERIIRLETDDADQEIAFAGSINHYQLMVEAFVSSVSNKAAVPLSLSDSVANMAVIDAAFQSIESQTWAAIPRDYE
ncbi:Gfo/Idh/MocA family protein [Marinagarivorans cellulosilyticus]|uniref:Uncharacterized protein n=1 Tax=Marinagarivorans cellulosilyticus TaxID=2721545 RepID=A0AAN1WIW0_9GAMM|nr:Gfo/Idh/MocA family oxidoreductase [Marinagarivorans cellulosilyticus]BCD98409.1 hypothetical protein MARGE09_P2610 [Marinagarivorans cellulosilyticus]